ncbi:MAG TPA: sugar phosphate isomerase/epimerase family protein [Thermomicrobiales bacterium]|nr:sugar phosphate isomerase/epimerase family protein [Thermomicrobiales bacterium]
MQSPPLGANLWIWESPVTTDVIRTYAPRVATWGFDLVELPVEQPDDWSAAEVHQILVDQGLHAGICAVMAPGRDLTTDDSAVVRSTQGYLRACIDAASAVGATLVAGPTYSPTGVTGPIPASERATRLERLATNLGPVLDHAASAGVRLAIEPLNRFETSLFNTVEQTMELVEMIDHQALGLLLDTFHMNIEERDAAAAIRLAGDRLYHFHACGNDRGAPGHDAIDWPAIRDALAAIDYRGTVSIESFTSANQTIATAASIWRPLAATQDAIATDGLAFLRELFGGQPG